MTSRSMRRRRRNRGKSKRRDRGNSMRKLRGRELLMRRRWLRSKDNSILRNKQRKLRSMPSTWLSKQRRHKMKLRKP